MIRIKIKRSHLHLVIGICFSGLFAVTACSPSRQPEATPTIEAQASQPQEQIERLTPANTATMIPTITDEGNAGATPDEQEDETISELGYPAPEDPISTVEEQASGYPAPEDQMPASGEQAGGYPAPSEESPPQLKTELEATDPSTFDLATGDIQLVEFFAFW